MVVVAAPIVEPVLGAGVHVALPVELVGRQGVGHFLGFWGQLLADLETTAIAIPRRSQVAATPGYAAQIEEA